MAQTKTKKKSTANKKLVQKKAPASFAKKKPVSKSASASRSKLKQSQKQRTKANQKLNPAVAPTPAVSAPQSQMKQFMTGMRWAIPLAAGILAVLYSILSFKPHIEATVGPPPVPNATVTLTESTETPSEVKPEAPSEANKEVYAVPAGEPRRIIIDEVGVNGYIQKVGLDKTNTITVPDNIHYVGWYVNGIRPGDAGVSLIAGHVTGRYTNSAVFSRLVDAKKGTRLKVEFGDYSTKTFEVVDAVTLSEAETSNFMLKKDPSITAQLNLITCVGTFNRTTGKYPNRLVVVSKLVE
jgi:LPXTG-site transpeptidase (sortase) family protein